MSNHDLLNEMIDKFGIEKMTVFAEQASFMFDVLYKQVIKNNPEELTEYNYERDWWSTKFEELKSKETCYSYYKIIREQHQLLEIGSQNK